MSEPQIPFKVLGTLCTWWEGDVDMPQQRTISKFLRELGVNESCERIVGIGHRMQAECESYLDACALKTMLQDLLQPKKAS